MININAVDKHNMNTCQYNHVIRQLKERKIEIYMINTIDFDFQAINHDLI